MPSVSIIVESSRPVLGHVTIKDVIMRGVPFRLLTPSHSRSERSAHRGVKRNLWKCAWVRVRFMKFRFVLASPSKTAIRLAKFAFRMEQGGDAKPRRYAHGTDWSAG